MNIRIGNDIRLNFFISPTQNITTENVKDVLCYVINIEDYHEQFPYRYVPTEYEIHGCGKPEYNVLPQCLPHVRGFHVSGHHLRYDNVLKGIYKDKPVFTADSFQISEQDGYTVISSMFPGDCQTICGTYLVLLKVVTEEESWGKFDKHTYLFDYNDEDFDLVELNGKSGNIVLNFGKGYNTVYSIPNVQFSYQDIPVAGGTIYPSLSYTQIATMIYDNGDTAEEIITEGATVIYSCDDYDVTSDGGITVEENTQPKRKFICTVSATVMLNDQTTVVTYDVYQKAAPKVTANCNIYVGTYTTEMVGSTPAYAMFQTLDDQTLIDNSTMYNTLNIPISTKLKGTANVWYIMYPEKLLDAVIKLSAEVPTLWSTLDQFENSCKQAVHDDITIGETTYKILAYYNYYLSDEEGSSSMVIESATVLE